VGRIREHTYLFPPRHPAGPGDLPHYQPDATVQNVDAFKAVDAGIAHQIGHYADAVRVAAGRDQVMTSGTPGLRADGTVPSDFADEATQAWQNVEQVLNQAGARLEDIVLVRQWLTDPALISVYSEVRGRFLRHEPASMLAVIPALVRPDFRVEIEVVAVPQD
jgi:enamine deaminase RidA (YjgF/YER057c/UK114 family)